MKVLVLGATGGTGRLIVRDALAKGHSVVALVRSKASAVWSASAPWGSGTASRDHGGFVFDRLFLPLLLSHAYKDKDGQEAAIRTSSLDWVIVRPAMLTNDPARGSVRSGTDLAGVNGAKLHEPMSLGSWWSN